MARGVERNVGETAHWPLKGSVFAPRSFVAVGDGSGLKAPKARLELQWIYSFRGNDCRNNLKWLNKTTMVYNAASLVVVHDTSSQEQSFFCGHDNDVMCMAVHPSRQWFASGQSCTVRNSASAKQARICLWNIDKESHPDHDHITVIEDFHQRSVNHVEFDSTGRYLITVGGDDDNSLALYDCVDPKKPVLMSTAGASKAKVVSARFNPNDHTQLVTFGVKHIKFWNLEKNESAARTHQKTQSWALKSKTGVFGKFDTQTILAAEWSPSSGIMYAGGFNGDISSWDKNNQTASIKAHEGPVHCLVWTSAGLLSGGKDGKVILWKEENQKLSQVSVVFDLASATQGRPIRSLPGEFVRSLDFEAQSQCIAVGTNENRIWTATLNGGDAQFVNGGHAGELWGLATHPSLPRAASVSVDGKIALWDTSSHQPIAQSVIGSSTSVDLETELVAKTAVDTDLTGGFCLSFSPSDHHLAIGLANGNVNVYSSSDLSFVKTIRRVGSASSKPAESAAKVSPLERLATHSKQAPSPSKQNSAVASASLRACDIKYSPAGDTLAVGFSDGQISIHDAKAEEFPLLGILKGHSGSINKFDFSRDGKHLQSSSTANELLYWDVKELQQITKTAELRDVEWSSWTVPFGWAMKGIWPAGVDGSHINAVARSNRGDLIASGDDDCVVKLFKFPSYDPKAQHRVYGGHSSHVTNVAFSFDDSALLSTGGQDCSLFLWKIVDADSSTGSESSSVGSDLANSRPASPAPGMPSSAPSSTAALRSLREMKDNGFISDDEFAKAEDILSTLSVKEKLIQLLAQPLSADTTPQLSSLLGGL